MRFTLFDRWGTQIGVITDVISAVHKDELNGEDSLTLTLASCDLVKGNRVVWRDRFGVWHEHIVNDLRTTHEDGRIRTVAYCETSLAELFGDYIVERRPYGVSAAAALQRALEDTRWAVGTVGVSGTASASFYHTSVREALSLIAENWGGELSATIGVGVTAVASRSVNLTTRGSDSGKRFEWTKDLKGITRTVAADDVCTALYGYGRGLEAYDEDGNPTGGFERKLTFGEINGGLDYVADETAKQTWGLPDGSGGKKHAFGRAEFPDCEDMDELLALTRAELARRKVPQVTYTASVIDLADAGYAFEDVRAGDTVAIIDREMGERLTGRVLCVSRDLFSESATVVTLGNIARSIGDVISGQSRSIGSLRDHAAAWDGAARLSDGYVNGVINAWNDVMNSTSGFVYQEPGEGITVYDRAKDQNPTMAMQLNGAGFRIANSKDSNGNWNWRTFGTGDGFTADLLNVGTIRGGANYWNLETGEFRMAASAQVGADGTTIGDIAEAYDGYENAITGVDVEYRLSDSATSLAGDYDWSTTAPEWADGKYMWQRTKTVTGAGASYSDPTCIAGARGADGTGVTVGSVEYGTSASAGTQPSSWSTTAPTSIAKGSWLWTRTTYSDGSTATTKSYVGTDGKDGDSAYAYTLTATPAALVRDGGGSISPTSVAFAATRAQGAGAPTAYAGRFVIAEHDGSSWATKYTSPSNESARSYSPTSTARLVRCTLYLAGGTSTQLDVQTVPIASDGADGTDGADAYTVLLTNESHTFAAGTSAALAGSATCSVIAYKGTTRVAATIGTISGRPTGMSTATYGNGTTSAYFTVSVTTSLTTRSGTLTVPVTVDGKSFSLTFSWSLALKGDTGDDGTGIASVVEQYYLSTSDATQAGGSWSATPAAYVSGRYYWTRSLVTWDDGNTSTTTPVLARGLNSANATATTAKGTADGVRTDFDVLNTQQGIFDKLTNNGQTQGIYLSGGLLYVNGTYIRSGTIDAGLVRAGTIEDSSGANKWDLDAGTLETTDILVRKALTIVPEEYSQVLSSEFKRLVLGENGVEMLWNRNVGGKNQYIPENQVVYTWGMSDDGTGVLTVHGLTVNIEARVDADSEYSTSSWIPSVGIGTAAGGGLVRIGQGNMRALNGVGDDVQIYARKLTVTDVPNAKSGTGQTTTVRVDGKSLVFVNGILTHVGI